MTPLRQPARADLARHAAATLVMMLLVASAFAQTPGSNRRPTPFIFHANVGEVLLRVSVTDKKGHAITTLPESDFKVYENGVPQRLEYFTQDDAPVSAGILIDNSGSMRSKRAEVQQAALNFVHFSNPKDEMFIVNFNDEYYLDAPLTNKLSVLQQGLERIESRGGTALYDATVASLDYLSRNAKNQKRALLIITDGDDDASRYTLEQTVHILQAKNTPIVYCIGLEDSDDTGAMRHDSERALKALAATTGGAAYFPKTLSQVNDITKAVAQDIRSQYTMTYHSNQTGTTFRTVKIDVKDRKIKHLIARTRNGYMPGTADAGQDAPDSELEY